MACKGRVQGERSSIRGMTGSRGGGERPSADEALGAGFGPGIRYCLLLRAASARGSAARREGDFHRSEISEVCVEAVAWPGFNGPDERTGEDDLAAADGLTAGREPFRKPADRNRGITEDASAEAGFLDLAISRHD